MNLPMQRQADDEHNCRHCGHAIYLRNRQQGPTWEHARGSEWCTTTRAEPAHVEANDAQVRIERGVSV